LRIFAGTVGLRVEAEVDGSGPVGTRTPAKICGGAIALVDVAVYGHGAGDSVIALHAPDGDGHIVNHAEAFAVVGKRMMESATDVEGDVILQSIIGGQN